MIKWASIVLSLVGFAVGVWIIVTSDTGPPELSPNRPPAVNPYTEGISASGVVEAASRNVQISSPEPGIVTNVFCQVNESVKVGDPLFQLDKRVLQAELAKAQAALEVAERQLERILALPRSEDVSPLRAALQLAKVKEAEADDEYERAVPLREKNVISEADFSTKTFAVQTASAVVAEAQANLDRVLAGAWKPDVQVAHSELGRSNAEVQRIQNLLERLVVCSPIDGVVLKRNIEPGEFTGGSSTPAMVIGDISVLHVRAQVNEADTPMLRQGARATAVLTGRIRREFKLRMIRIEPLALPKTQLSGSDVELVDTRVVDVVFQLERDASLYPGQIVDTFIEAMPVAVKRSGETVADAPN